MPLISPPYHPALRCVTEGKTRKDTIVPTTKNIAVLFPILKSPCNAEKMNKKKIATLTIDPLEPPANP